MVLLLSLLTFPSIFVSAEEIMNGASYDPNIDAEWDLQEVIKKVINDDRYTPEQKEMFVEKLKMEESGRIETVQESIHPMASLGPLISLNVPCYNQTTDYTCGAATMKQTLQFLNGTSLTERQYAVILGTQTSSGAKTGKYPTIAGLRIEINKKQSKNNYVLLTPTSASSLYSKILLSMQTYKALPVMLINETGLKTYFGYVSSGHFVNTSGLQNQYSYINYQITDCWRASKAGGPGLSQKYMVSQENLYTAIKQTSAKQYIC